MYQKGTNKMIRPTRTQKVTKHNQTRTRAELQLLQSLPLGTKILWAEEKIKEWYEYHNGKVYISFSGGKDSTVLLHLIRSIYPGVPAVFSDTGLEWPEIREFVKSVDNVIWLKPKMNFKEVLNKYGYPIVSKEVSQQLHEYRTTKSDYLKHRILNGTEKSNGFSGKLAHKWRFLLNAPFPISHKCCTVLKKNPFREYEKVSGLLPYVGTMATDSRRRLSTYLEQGCNAFDTKRPQSKSLSIWTEQDILNYIKNNGIDYCKIYGKIQGRYTLKFTGENRTGCIFCGFGCHLDKGYNKFQRMYKTHPNLHKYCMKNLGMQEVLDYCKIPTKPDGFGF